MLENDVLRYLARKPMTTTEILKEINTRKTGIPKEELMPLLVSALKRINPHKQKVKGIMYLSLKSNWSPDPHTEKSLEYYLSLFNQASLNRLDSNSTLETISTVITLYIWKF